MLIDVNVSFGGRESIQRFAPETALAQLKRVPVGLAFVHCHQGMTDQFSANDQTFALCRDHEHLRPTAAIHPRDTFAWRAEVDRCLAAGVRLFRLYPDQGEWPVRSVFVRQIVERLQGTGAAVLIEATTPGLPSAIAEQTADARLPVIFTEARYYPLSELLPLLERYPHLYLETSRLTSPDGIEDAVATVGADRLLFGSGTARYPAWVAWQTLERAEIESEVRDAIAWRNAARLLDVSPEPVPAEPSSPLMVDVDAEPLPVIDVHLHDKLPGTPIKHYPPAAYGADLDRSGIAHGVCSSVTAIFYDLKQGNDEQAALVSALPRLRGYVVVDPRYYDDSLRELRRLEADDDGRFVGVKIHAAYAQTLTRAPSMRRLLAAVAAYRKPVLIHNLGADWPEALVELALEFPDLPIIAAHAGYGDAPHPTHDAAERLAPAANIWLEYCSTYLTVDAIRRGINAAGVGRLLYGSDFPLIAQPYMRAAYEDAELSPDEAKRILVTNARRLFPTFDREMAATR